MMRLLLLIALSCLSLTVARNSVTSPQVSSKSFVSKGSAVSPTALVVQGGAANTPMIAVCDSNTMIAVKTVVSSALQAAGLLGVIKLGEIVASSKNFDFLPIVAGLSIAQWISVVFVAFSASTIKSWIEGGVVGAATKQVLMPDVIPGDADWYSNLKKPWFNPPGWVFPIMWLIVSKPTQVIAVSKILKDDTSKSSHYWPALAVYCFHLALGDAWNDVFFEYQRIGLGAIVITTFFGVLLTSAKLFGDINPEAGKFLWPTCGWVLVATALNVAIYLQNPNDGKKK